MTTTTQAFVEVITDFENNSEDFWNAVAKLQDEGNELAKLLESDRVVVTSDEAGQIKELVEGLPGWNDPQAAEFAPHPLMFQDVERDFREEGYDSFDPVEGPEVSESDRPSDYASFPKMSADAKEAANTLYDQGHALTQSEWKQRCESLESAISDLFVSANNDPLRGEGNSLHKCELTDKIYSVQVNSYIPFVAADWLRLWDGADEGEQNPANDDGTLEPDLQSFADDPANSDESREAVRAVLAKLRAIESEYSNKGYEEAIHAS